MAIEHSGLASTVFDYFHPTPFPPFQPRSKALDLNRVLVWVTHFQIASTMNKSIFSFRKSIAIRIQAMVVLIAGHSLWGQAPPEVPFTPELVQKAEAGDPESQYRLSRCYVLGNLGVAEDLKESTKWHIKAAEQGHLEAEFTLGTHYFAGLGVAKDLLQAGKWMNLAVKGGHPKAPGVLKVIERDMTPDQKVQVRQLAADFKPTPSAAAAGTPLKKWTSADGRTITADLVRVEGESVILKREDGQVFQVPLAKLSPESQAAAKNAHKE